MRRDSASRQNASLGYTQKRRRLTTQRRADRWGSDLLISAANVGIARLGAYPVFSRVILSGTRIRMLYQLQGSPAYGLNRQPRLSANQLAEYLSATPSRRTSIVREAKFPKTSQVALYRDARLAVARQLCAGPDGPDQIGVAISRLRERAADLDASPWTIDDCRRSIDVLEAFLRVGNELGLARYEFRTVSGTLPHVLISGVSVSVSISATVHRRTRDGTTQVGGLTMFLSKAMSDDAASPERAAVSALLCFMLAEASLGHLGAPDHRLCLVLDVAGGKVFPAPKGQTRRRKDMAHACAEVARAWSTVTPPRDYDGPDL